MSRRNRHRNHQGDQINTVAAAAVIASVPSPAEGAWPLHPPVVPEEAAAVITATVGPRQDGAPHVRIGEAPKRPAALSSKCERQIVYQDSLRWRCACGAEGPVRRSNDGIPYVNDDVLAHQPGENRS